MRVICIDAKTRVLQSPLVEGKIYEVGEGKYCNEGCCYDVLELGVGCNKNRFIPLSNIDEIELVNERLLTEPA